jgi:ketosteroid isomerase-like protein
MSQENVEIVKGLLPGPEVDLAALFRDDAASSALINAVQPLFHPEFECFAVSAVQGTKRYVGLEGFRATWLDWMEPWETYRNEVEDVIDAGDEVVVVLGRAFARRSGSEAEVNNLGGAVWTVVDGRVMRAAFYADPQEALEAAGLSE